MKCDICNKELQLEKKQDVDGNIHIRSYCVLCKKYQYVRKTEAILKELEGKNATYTDYTLKRNPTLYQRSFPGIPAR